MSLDAAEARALAHAEHGDPFALLGPHEGARAGQAGVWIRSVAPGALGLTVVDVEGATLAEAEAVDVEGGVFEAFVPGQTRAQLLAAGYRLALTYPHEHDEQVEDPYRFGSDLGELDRHLLGEGTHLRPWTVLGAHPRTLEGVAGVRFCVWAPNAASVAVIGDFNTWDGRRHPMRAHPGLGVWELFIPGVEAGARYKFELRLGDGSRAQKADPYAFAAELRPATASVVAAQGGPRRLPKARAEANHRRAPMAIYEVHLGSWRRSSEGEGFLDWDALAEQLPAYAAELGFTHLELMPIAEHPFDGSWGYQVTGMFAPTRRHGDGEGFARFVAACQDAGLGLILDWVPAHFPTDAHGLARFDGTALYEYADPKEGFHRDWNTLIYNFGRTEVRNFLVGSALYWLEHWGLDGLRVDAVASMLYRDYSREPGEWIPNAEGGRENLEAIAFLRRLNEVVGAHAPGAVTLAEESTAWPGVSKPTDAGGLGFHYKWNMGWMHDSLAYMAKDPVHRSHHHDQLTFSLVYAFDENFVLPLSHDEVVHGKGSLIAKMPGDRWRRFANLRAYYAFMWTHPGKKLLFMGCEFAQEREWNHDAELDWWLLDPGRCEGHGEHRGVQALIRDLNGIYRGEAALHARDCEPEGFEWIAADERETSVIAFVRRSGPPEAPASRCVLVVCNFTPVPRHGYRLGLPEDAAARPRWRERLNTDSAFYGGSDVGNGGVELRVEDRGAHGRARSMALTLPPLATLILEPA